MRKNTKIILSIFVAGVLLGGIGTGVAASELGNLSYSGEHFLGKDHMVTETFDQKIKVGEGQKILVRYVRSNEVEEFEIIYKDGIPKDTIRYEITYIKDNVEIETFFDEAVYIESENYEEITVDETEQLSDQIDDENAKVEESVVSIVGLLFDYYENDFEKLMETKDIVLQELKQGKIGVYTVANIKSIKIYASPELEPYIISGYTY